MQPPHRAGRFTVWLYLWLPIFMGCHCRPDRSFHWNGRQFPICARCTGVLAGFLLAIAGAFFWTAPPGWLVLMTLPGVLDGVVQLKTRYESRNLRRLWTGFLMGYGSLSLLFWSLTAVHRLGAQFAAWLTV